MLRWRLTCVVEGGGEGTRRETKQNKTKQNKTKQNKTKQNKTKQNKTKQNKTNLMMEIKWELERFVLSLR